MDVHTELLMAGRLVLAAFLGGLIGLERELRGRAAGIRTFAAVSLGSCAFTIISYLVVPEGNETTRVAAQIVTGVGFLGAGVIWRSRGHIGGLTTSATLWASGAIGMAVGYGLYILGSVTTILLLILLLLRLIPGLEHHPDETVPDQK